MTNTCDEQQYESHAYSLTYPEHLEAIGLLFGLNPAPYDRGKVLELGCASGGNILPMAYNFPRASFFGIDLSAKQIEQGQRLIDALALNNIRLEHQSILDFDINSGPYDYIICHGVYSWVPDNVREKILEICQKTLAPEGIACISYNTLPCWNMVMCVRDMMKFHVRTFKTPEERVQQARILLNFLTKGLEQENTPYAKFLRDEIKIVSNAQDYYIFHEYLEEVNEPVYFHEFISQVKTKQLSYLGDSNIPLMFPGNLKENFSKKLAEIQDVVKVGQYMDFIRNQRFRTTLICHDSVTLNRQLHVNDVEKFSLSFSGKFQKRLLKEKIQSNETVTFESQGIILTLQKPLIKACMSILHDRYGKPIHYETLLAQSMGMVGETNQQAAKQALNSELNLMRLILAGMISVHVDEGINSLGIPQLPKTTEYIQKIAKVRERVPNLRHETHRLLPIERIVLQYLDGKHKISKINRALEEKIRKNELTLTDEHKQPVTKKQEIHDRVQKITLSTLENLSRKAYLLG